MIEVSILGATGLVGQRFVSLLSKNKDFKIVQLVASPTKKGLRYKDAVNWLIDEEMPKEVSNMTLDSTEALIKTKIVFSALPTQAAFDIEDKLSREGHYVFSNASAHRYDDFVPIIVPEVNPEHFDAIKYQNRKGFIITNPNCSTAGLVIPLKAVKDKFGIKNVLVVTMQAISGAGYPGVAALSIYDNIIPHIEKEEDKIKLETRKILGQFKGKFELEDILIDARCTRVPVRDGHTEVVFVELEDNSSREEFINALADFKGLPQKLNLPSSPLNPILVFDTPSRPQPYLDRNSGRGMAVSVGNIQKSNLFSFTFTVLSHNTIRGAAGGSIENAELFLKGGYNV